MLIKQEERHHHLPKCQPPEAPWGAQEELPVTCSPERLARVLWFLRQEPLSGLWWVASESETQTLCFSFDLSWWLLFCPLVQALWFVVLIGTLTQAQAHPHPGAEHLRGPRPALRLDTHAAAASFPLPRPHQLPKVLHSGQGQGSKARYFLSPWVTTPTHSGCVTSCGHPCPGHTYTAAG